MWYNEMIMSIVLIEGSSTAYGRGVEPGQGLSWAERLEHDARRYAQSPLYELTRVVSRARVGSNITEINGEWLATGPLVAPPGTAIRILSTGQNEARIKRSTGEPRYNLSQFAAELALFGKHTRSVGFEPIYVGPQLLDPARAVDYERSRIGILSNERASQIARVMQAHAATEGAPYVDVIALQEATDPALLLSEDGCHPNEAGHRAIYRGVRLALNELHVFPTLAEAS
jgi:hypothetical protein